MNRCAPAMVLALTISGIVYSQPPSFEVASVRRHPGGGPRSLQFGPDGAVFTNVSVSDCLQAAYGVRRYQISGPDWIETEGYDIRAKAAGPEPRERLAVMLQTLLVDRFKLVLHREQKQLAVYALVRGKGAPKLTEVRYDPATAGAGVRLTGFLQLTGRMASMAQLADALGDMLFNGDHLLERPVLDQTSLTGFYNFQLTWAPDPGRFGPAAASDPSGASVFTAIPEQLGLKLEAQKAPVEMLVVDSADKEPTGN